MTNNNINLNKSQRWGPVFLVAKELEMPRSTIYSWVYSKKVLARKKNGKWQVEVQSVLDKVGQGKDATKKTKKSNDCQPLSASQAEKDEQYNKTLLQHSKVEEKLVDLLSPYQPKLFNRYIKFCCPQCKRPDAFTYPQAGYLAWLICSHKSSCIF